VSYSQITPPTCYGKQYDNESDMCRACSFNTPCRREVMKVAYGPQYTPPAPPTQYAGPPQVPYYNQVPTPPVYQPQAPQYQQPTWGSQYRPFQPPASPQPGSGFRVPVATAPQAPMTVSPVGQFAQQAVTQVVQHMLQNQAYTPIGVYGSVNDPAIGLISAMPLVLRPQMHGESFITRVLKNLALAFIETFANELKIGVRQATLPPGPPRQSIPAAHKTVEV
jgi:hypothetical protein